MKSVPAAAKVDPGFPTVKRNSPLDVRSTMERQEGVDEGFKQINNTGGPLQKQKTRVSQLTILGTQQLCLLIERISRSNRMYCNFQSGCGVRDAQCTLTERGIDWLQLVGHSD